MDSKAVLSEVGFSCPVCYNIYEDPVVLSCSHSFCKACLKKWWTKNSMRECPICKTRSPTNNPPCNLALKNLCEALLQERAQGASTGSEEVCSLHSEKLKLFCMDHQQLVCLVCRDSKEHTNHSFRPISEFSQCCRAEVLKTMEPLKERLKVLQKDKADWVKTIKDMTVQAQEIERQINENFEKPQKVLKEECEARICALGKEKNNNIHMIKGNIKSLNEEMNAVSDSIRDVKRHLEAPDVSFLKNYKATVERTKLPLPQESQWPSGALSDLTNHLETLNMTSLVNQIEHLTKSAMSRSVEYRLTAFTSDLRKYACQLTLDPNPVRCNTFVSVMNGAVMFVPISVGYVAWDQVLCREGLTGRCYWEVDWDGNTSIGVTYRGISRRGESLGCNDQSWVLACSYKCYTARHNNIETQIALPVSSYFSFSSFIYSIWQWYKSGLGRLGIYLDWPAGSLSFYTVSSDTLTHIHTFYCTFTEELLPVIEVMSPGSASLCQMNTHTCSTFSQVF